MTRSKVSLFLLIVLLATAINATAQPMDRPALLSKIESQREQLRAKEAAFLLPSEEDFASFRDFLLQPDTGLVRLMPREKYDGEMLIRGGGAYYSFVKLTNAYGGGSDIALEQERLGPASPERILDSSRSLATCLSTASLWISPAFVTSRR